MKFIFSFSSCSYSTYERNKSSCRIDLILNLTYINSVGSRSYSSLLIFLHYENNLHLYSRFTSSAMQQWINIKRSYTALCTAFDLLFPNRSNLEENQFKLMGAVTICPCRKLEIAFVSNPVRKIVIAS